MEKRFVFSESGNRIFEQYGVDSMTWESQMQIPDIAQRVTDVPPAQTQMVLATTVLFSPIGLLSLLSKKRNHYLTVGFKDDSGQDKVAVFELDKDIVRTTVPLVETR